MLSRGHCDRSGRVLASPQRVSRAIGIGRLVIGGALLAAPVPCTRLLGLDAGTAKRAAFLARMAAVRDVGLGVGTLAAGPTAAAAPWLLVGAASDAVDALVVAGALKQGSVRGVPAAGLVVGAAGTVAIAVGAVLGLRRQD